MKQMKWLDADSLKLINRQALILRKTWVSPNKEAKMMIHNQILKEAMAIQAEITAIRTNHTQVL